MNPKDKRNPQYKNLKVNKEGHTLPPKKSFAETLKESIDKAKEQISNMESGAKASKVEGYGRKIDAEGYVIPPQSSFREKVSKSIKNSSSKSLDDKTKEATKTYHTKYEKGSGQEYEDNQAYDLQSQEGISVDNMTELQLDNNQSISEEADLESMTDEARANYFAREYHQEFGEIPTSFEHTYTGDDLSLTDADLEDLSGLNSSLQL